MPSRNAYLKYLEERYLREESVLPLLSPEQRPKFLGSALQALGSRALNSLSEREQQFILHALENVNRNANGLLETINGRLRERLRSLGCDTQDEVFAGVFPTRDYNAHTVRRGEGYLVLFDHGAFQLTEWAVSIFIGNWDREKKAKLLAAMIEEYRRSGLTENEARITPPPHTDYSDPTESRTEYELKVLLTNVAQEFALAHEYGHIAGRHLHGPESADHELEADLWALRATVDAQALLADAAEGQVACNLAGPFLFLGVACLIERSDAALGVARETAERLYPPALDRVLLAWVYFASRGFAEHIYVGVRFLELVNDCCEALFGEPIGIELGAMEVLGGAFAHLFGGGDSRDGPDELGKYKQFIAAAKGTSILREPGESAGKRDVNVETGWFGEAMP